MINYRGESLIFRDFMPFAMSRVCERFRRMLDTAASRGLALWWSIPLGPRASFYGLPKFRKHPTATITIARRLYLSLRAMVKYPWDRSAVFHICRSGCLDSDWTGFRFQWHRNRRIEEDSHW
jgi:hypothetical protein